MVRTLLASDNISSVFMHFMDYFFNDKRSLSIFLNFCDLQSFFDMGIPGVSVNSYVKNRHTLIDAAHLFKFTGITVRNTTLHSRTSRQLFVSVSVSGVFSAGDIREGGFVYIVVTIERRVDIERGQSLMSGWGL